MAYHAVVVPCPVCNALAYVERAGLPYVTLADGQPTFGAPFDARNLADPALYRRVGRYAGRVAERVRDGHGLLFHGPSGSGKTRMAAEIGLAAALAGIDTRFSTLVGILDKVKAGFDDGTADTIWQGWKDAELLILDDLGTDNRSSDWVPERVFDLFNERIVNRRCTIITTKYEPALLGARISARDPEVGGSIVSRLREMCTFVAVRAKRDYREVLQLDGEW